MAEGVNLRFSEKLREFVEELTYGLYGSASEYLRELVRRDYEAEGYMRGLFDALEKKLVRRYL